MHNKNILTVHGWIVFILLGTDVYVKNICNAYAQYIRENLFAIRSKPPW